MTTLVMRKPMVKTPLFVLLLSTTLALQAQAMEKLTLAPDEYINPDHAPIMLAQQTGAFAAEGLEINCAAFRPRPAADAGGHAD